MFSKIRLARLSENYSRATNFGLQRPIVKCPKETGYNTATSLKKIKKFVYPFIVKDVMIVE